MVGRLRIMQVGYFDILNHTKIVVVSVNHREGNANSIGGGRIDLIVSLR